MIVARRCQSKNEPRLKKQHDLDLVERGRMAGGRAPVDLSFYIPRTVRFINSKILSHFAFRQSTHLFA
jgi:hypothetical protein